MLSDGNFELIEDGAVGPPFPPFTYAESEESGDFDINHSDSSFQRVFWCNNDQYTLFVDYLYGFSYYANTDNGAIERILPEPHNLAPAFFCSGAHGKQVSVTGSVDGVGAWKGTKVTATYKPPGYAVLNSNEIGTMTFTDPITGSVQEAPNELARYVTRSYHYIISQVTTQNIFRFVSRWACQPQPSGPCVNGLNPNAALESSPGRMLVLLEKEITWHNVPARSSNYWEPPNRKTVEALAGCVSTQPFDNHNPGTIVLAGYNPVQQKPTLDTGIYMWDITYRFICQDHGATPTNLTDYAGNFLADVAPYVGMQWIYDNLYDRYDLISAGGTASKDDSYLYPSATPQGYAADLNALFYIQPWS